MKNLVAILVLLGTSSLVQAKPFTAASTITLYYYQPNTQSAAVSEMYASALETCKAIDPNDGILPVRLSKISITHNPQASVTASAQFVCVNASGTQL